MRRRPTEQHHPSIMSQSIAQESNLPAAPLCQHYGWKPAVPFQQWIHTDVSRNNYVIQQPQLNLILGHLADDILSSWYIEYILNKQNENTTFSDKHLLKPRLILKSCTKHQACRIRILTLMGGKRFRQDTAWENQNCTF